jgi:transcriptional regulator with PAS, ATPase and Fis domain
MKILFTWLGITDLRASRGQLDGGLGPIAMAMTQLSFDEVIVLTDHKPEDEGQYLNWLASKVSSKITKFSASLTSPINFGEIYESAIRCIDDSGLKNEDITFHLSPGTPAMAAVWIILSKTRYSAELIESSFEHGARKASVPFDISADYIPDLLRKSDENLNKLSTGSHPEHPEFDTIVHRCEPMKRLISKAQKVAYRSVPVLIHGESGTGKELLARAIHNSSPRKEKPFIPVNCGAIPKDLIDAELFGHTKGAFSGAAKERKGFFESAHGGSLFLDEIGELPQEAQVRLLRALQEGQITRVGESEPIKVDVRIISATNRDLIQEVAENRFREDLFHRLAVGILTLPPLRERTGDLSLLIDTLFDKVQEESLEQPGYTHKEISAGARNLMLSHPWPGNIRELLNTLRRVSIWCDGDQITAEDIKESMLPMKSRSGDGVLHQSITQGFSLPDTMKQVAVHYLSKALEECGDNKTQAAEKLGLPSYQTLSNWMKKYDLA